MSSKEEETTRGKISRGKFLNLTGKTIAAGGAVIAMGGAGIIIKELDDLNREAQKTYSPNPT